jgi:hypothetical protein
MINGERLIFIPAAYDGGLTVELFSISSAHAQETVRRPLGATFYQLLFITEGKGRVILGGVEYPLRRGSCFYVGRGERVEYYDDGGLVSAFITVVGDGARALEKKYASCGYLYVDGVSVEGYRAEIETIVRAYSGGASSGELSSLAYSFFVDFFESIGRVTTPTAEVARYIERNLDKKLTLEVLARVGSMSVSGLCHKFKSEFGKTVVEYILEKRLAYARSLLTSGEAVAVKEVAVASGLYLGIVEPQKYGSIVSPSQPGDTASASLSSSAKE